jgi:hypothetical protein
MVNAKMAGGLGYTVSAQPDAAGITIRVSGIPTETSFAADVTITIPAGKLVSPDGAPIGDIAVTGTVKYNIGQAAVGGGSSVGTPASEMILVAGTPTP